MEDTKTHTQTTGAYISIDVVENRMDDLKELSP